ncbi:hypothetical protein L211DRAFT_833494 [Terfezia boudieri ATCC MYA-4762]|uniref:Extracellular membrane protein CFEM domain-containing protein n=1 Tax=Terfezia boudieri ATCC MYA-4762 TaxID=1051890 RepID=A0A3N4M796_9PEZI|nr:hypothetical protein L211DRAFT_833494 [Terfezia boudieri ATCC MYA-4762]
MLAKYFFIAAAAIVGGVMAVKCDSQTQFDLCKEDMKKTYLNCKDQDYQCLCNGNKIILSNCYPLCPQDDGRGTQESIVSSWCVSAGGDMTSSVPVPTITTTASTGTATGTGTTYPSSTSTSTSTSKDGNNTGTETTTTPTASTSDSAGNMLAPAGFIVAAAAIAGLVL